MTSSTTATQTSAPPLPASSKTAKTSAPLRPAMPSPAQTPASTRPASQPRPVSSSRPTDDEILGLAPLANAAHSAAAAKDAIDANAEPSALDADSSNDANSAEATDAALTAEPENLRAAFDANPELREAWHDANAYRESFATPEEARQATTLLADLNQLDALFFSQRPEDHAALARSIAALDPAAFASLASAMSAQSPVGARHAVPAPTTTTTQAASAPSTTPLDVSPNPTQPASQDASTPQNQNRSGQQPTAAAPPTDAQLAFLTAANASAVEGVVTAIESQVERLLPAGVSKNARTRVVGEIYRELDAALRSNHQLSAQMRDAFRSGSLDDEHQRAVVSMITSRARQALPAVAKRVLNEWTSTLVSANQERRSRQRSAEGRIDIAGSSGAGNDGRRSMSPRDLDYARLSDSDILNL
jgi:hypothetical protein